MEQSMNGIPSKIIVFCYIFPVIIAYLLPSSIENKLMVKIWDISFFSPYFIYLFLPILSSKYCNFKPWNKKIVLFCILWSFIGIISNINFYGERILNDICSGLGFYYLLLIFLYCPLKLEHLSKIKSGLLLLWIVLFIELLLYSLGILTHSSSHISETTGGISRLQTTIGAPTATAGVLLILGACVFVLIKKRIYKLLFIFAWNLALVLTLSRGALLGGVIFSFYWIIKTYYSKKNKFKSITILSIIILLIYSSGLFNPIIERNQHRAVTESDITSGRTEYWNRTLFLWNEKPIMGWGIGNIQPRSGQYLFSSQHYTLPHNSYLLCLGENGIVGLILLLLLLYGILKSRYNDEEKDGFVLLLIIMLTLLNTETLLFFPTFYIPFIFLILILCVKNEKELSLKRNKF